MILIDTSVWIDATRMPSGQNARVLRELIESDDAALALPVRMELLAGIAQRDRAVFRRALTALPVVAPTEETWALIESWVAPAADAGHRFAISDLLIAGLAHELHGLVWSLDRDFEYLAALGYVELYHFNTAA
jgi:predicted nucleic acid-binding protein